PCREDQEMKPIRVCFTALLAYPLFNPEAGSEFGGAEVQLYYLATELAKDPRFEVVFLTGDFGQPERESREGVELRKLGVSGDAGPLRKAYGYLAMVPHMKKLGADIYIQRAAVLLTGIVAFAARSGGRKFIYMTAHDLDIRPGKPGWRPPGMIGTLIWKFYKTGFAMADLVVVQHEKQKEELKRLCGRDGYIRRSAHRITDAGNGPVKETVLWVARCEDWKQPECFLALARSFPGEKFCMICPRSHDGALFERTRSEAAGIANLQFVDYVPFHEIDGYFRRARILVNTSRGEGFPNTFVQAMKSRTPILSLNADPDGMLGKYNVGRCAGGDFNALVEGLDTILKDVRLRGEMAENGYRYALSRHDIRDIVEEDKKMFLALMEREG
ncbi:MAG TPA: glycosyltransferase family 4 protein, partial [Dissulfurispiraceae bacterium]